MQKRAWAHLRIFPTVCSQVGCVLTGFGIGWYAIKLNQTLPLEV